MAFGITRKELMEWKKKVKNGEIAFLTHFWYDPRFPEYHSVTKVGCCHKSRLIQWGKEYGLKEEWIHDHRQYPHFDLLGKYQLKILEKNGFEDHIIRFKLKPQR
ncbi:hypothetical protein [Bacillus alveayuensis]|uniref:hypothetical protein n=1 Tax=Aeribacillus alveayuensis TaxID=279215 RepID=UPI0005D11734|nr:hypothetical protein [Bacillus alveayuensis]